MKWYWSMNRNLKIVRRESKYFLYREILLIKSMIIYYIISIIIYNI